MTQASDEVTEAVATFDADCDVIESLFVSHATTIHGLSELGVEHACNALKRIRARLAAVERERDAANKLLDGYAKAEPPIVTGALDAQADAERRLFAERAAHEATRNLGSGWRDACSEAEARADRAEAALDRAKEACRVLAQAGVNEKSRADAAERALAEAKMLMIGTCATLTDAAELGLGERAHQMRDLLRAFVAGDTASGPEGGEHGDR